jgi:MOSC domain-containing protein YiiM
MKMTVVSLNISLPEERRFGERTVRTGGRKLPVPSAVLRFGNFEGDGQADLVRHGGPDRSVCLYAADHYRYWNADEGLSLKPGDFCENLTVEGALEDRICIGDIYAIGGARVQVSLPRDPCGKIDLVSGVPGLAKRAIANGRCGFHMRTLQEGPVRAGDGMTLVERQPAGITMAAVLEQRHGRAFDRALIETLIGRPELAEEGRRFFRRKLEGSPQPD